MIYHSILEESHAWQLLTAAVAVVYNTKIHDACADRFSVAAGLVAVEAFIYKHTHTHTHTHTRTRTCTRTQPRQGRRPKSTQQIVKEMPKKYIIKYIIGNRAFAAAAAAGFRANSNISSELLGSSIRQDLVRSCEHLCDPGGQ